MGHRTLSIIELVGIIDLIQLVYYIMTEVYLRTGCYWKEYYTFHSQTPTQFFISNASLMYQIVVFWNQIDGRVSNQLN